MRCNGGPGVVRRRAEVQGESAPRRLEVRRGAARRRVEVWREAGRCRAEARRGAGRRRVEAQGTGQPMPAGGTTLVESRRARDPTPVGGMTLVEVVVVLALTGILLGMSLPRLAGGADRWVVREAREEVIGLLYHARVEARRYGGATLEVETGGEVVVRRFDGQVVRRWRPTTPGVVVEVAGSRDRAELDFGPAGLGRVANATLKVRRGRQEAEIVISSLGRVRR